MAWISEFPDDGGETGGGGTSETQRSPLPKSRVKKRSREPDGNTATADTIDPNRKKAATTMPVPTTVRTESAQTDRPCSTGSSSSVSSKKKLRFQLPTGIQSTPNRRGSKPDRGNRDGQDGGKHRLVLGAGYGFGPGLDPARSGLTRIQTQIQSPSMTASAQKSEIRRSTKSGNWRFSSHEAMNRCWRYNKNWRNNGQLATQQN